MQTALHIYALVRELNDTIPGATVSATEFYKKEREGYIIFKGEKGAFALGLVYHPVGFGTFIIPAGKLKVETSEKPWPFFQPVLGGTVQNVTQIDFDRIVKIEINKGDEHFSIIAESIGPNGNLWLLDSKDHILATLRHRKYDPAVPYAPPPGADKLNPFKLTAADLTHTLAKSESVSPTLFLKKIISGFDDTLAAEVLHRAALDEASFAISPDNQNISKLLWAIAEIAHTFDHHDHAYLYDIDRKKGAYPFRLHITTAEPVRCKSLSMAVYEAIRSGREEVGERSERDNILDAVGRAVKKLEKKMQKIREDIATADRFDDYRRYAELLKINMTSIRKGKKEIELDDIYMPDGGKVKIPLDPALTASENADEYFKKFRKGKEGLSLLERRLEVTSKELDSARHMLHDLERDFDHAAEKYAAELSELLPRAVERKTPAPRLPYKPYTLSTGVTILVGRDGADNDSTTFGHAKPYELWFHAAQCPGSHVVMKFPDKNFQPSKAEIAETAAVAAYHSKAKNSKSVPVIYTERKYVHKPRNAKPGLVTVEREKMIMVIPKKIE